MTAPRVTIRGAAPSDLAAIAALQTDSFSDPWDAASIARLAALPGAVLLVAVAGSGTLCGYALGHAIGEVAELTSIAVAPEARRAGLGGRLLAMFEGVAASLGAERVVLDVAADNNPACRMYAARGYIVAGERPGYYRRGRVAPVDAVVMARGLN
ncbi:MAG: GNAT family N-acetyltransferase [Alphaproteobacteria bacterium]|nr:GNAT family N-acetyltransferase [Alphaproteobacteria bacterium]